MAVKYIASVLPYHLIIISRCVS